jgi:hypothetical protein
MAVLTISGGLPAVAEAVIQWWTESYPPRAPEPTMFFPVQWDKKGNVTEAFTADFYLQP